GLASWLTGSLFFGGSTPPRASKRPPRNIPWRLHSFRPLERPYNPQFHIKSMAVLGSTGSIGRASLDVVAAFPDRFHVAALAAGRSLERLARQIELHEPELVSIEREEDIPRLRALLPSEFRGRIR